VNPWAGAVLSIIIIIVAYFLAGWSFRLTVFGSVYAWDFITGRRNRFRPAPDANWMFTARRIEKVPIRTYGKLLRGEQGKLALEYRPLWFAGRSGHWQCPKESTWWGAVVLSGNHVTGARKYRGNVLLTLPPRYRSHEEEVARIYGITEVRDIGLLRASRQSGTR